MPFALDDLSDQIGARAAERSERCKVITPTIPSRWKSNGSAVGAIWPNTRNPLKRVSGEGAESMANSTVADARLHLPLKMLKRHGEGDALPGETALKNLQEARRRHGKVLERAIQIAGYSKGEACYELATVTGDTDPISQSQLSAWLAGTENPQSWRFEQHPRLGRALLVAQGEAREQDDSGVVVTMSIGVQLRKAR